MNNISIQELKQKTAFLSFFLVLLAFTAKANPIDLRQAREVGARFINANTRMRTNANDLRLATTYNTTIGTSAFHVFNTANGFVIVAADDCATPILGYSDEGHPFDPNDIPIQMEEYLQGFVEQIQYGVENHIQPDENTVRQWNMVMATGRLNENRTNNAVEPLLTALWNQGCYYNHLCPEDSRGPCGHTYAGCAATAMGLILHYWGYPATGSGSHSYTPGAYPQQSVNFWETEYDWPNMPDELTPTSSDTEINAVAQLLWHCGVAINMMYGHNGSGAYPSSIPTALTEFFNYSPDLFSQSKNDNSSWLSLVKSNLDIGRPIHYSGWNASGSGGHSFVCDGYNSSDQLHFNWGWSGIGNGYYALNALFVQGNNFSYNNYAIFNIHPYEGTETYTINTESNPEAGGTTIGDGLYHYGTTATLTATPNDNYIFVNWTKNGYQVSSHPTCLVTVREDATYTANFRRTNVFDISIGESTTNTELLPLTASSKYSLTQQIYLANEINANGPITDVSFYYSGTTATTFDINLYLKHTQKDSYTSATDWVSLSPTDLHYSGSYSIDGTPGWKRISLDTPFNYNGTDNIVVCVDNNTGNSFSGFSWAACQCNSDKTIILSGDDFNFNPYSPVSGSTSSLINQITFTLQVTQGTDFVVSPDPIDLGHRPSGAWMRPIPIDMYNNGLMTNINGITTSNPFFIIDLEEVEFPLLSEYHDHVNFQISTGMGSGQIDASLDISYGNGLTKQTQLTATGYTPSTADVWETAQTVTSFPYSESLSSPFRPFYNNYELPYSDIVDGPDAVYKITLTEESRISAAITNGDNGKLALYADGFGGLGGPDVNNNYDNSTQKSDWMYYVRRGGMFHRIGNNNSNFYWGVMFPIEKLEQHKYTWLTKIAIDEATDCTRTNTLKIYLGGDNAPENLIQTKDFLPRGDGELHEIDLDEAIYIDGTQNLWITFHQVGDAYPAEFAPLNGVPNSRWYSNDGVTWEQAEGNVTFPIHGYFTNQKVPYIGGTSTPSSIDDMDLMPGTYYLVASSTSENWDVEIDKESVSGPLPPFDPEPADGATGINYDTIQFSWLLGEGTTEYKLMFGTSPYCERTLVNWTDNLQTSFTLIESLDWNETYYWKIGERNSDCPNGITSPVWSFTTESFVPKEREISVEVYPSGGIVTGAGTYTDGQTCTLVATPLSGYVFKRWTESGMTISNNPRYSFPVHESKNLIAVFASTSNIVFANDNVKNKCVSAWDANGDGELSYSEAADVTVLQNQFSYALGITSFDELQYFTGLTTISGGFTGTGLTSITIPRFVSSMNQLMFFTTRSLASLHVVPENQWYDSRDNCNGIIRTETNQLEYGCMNTVIPNTVTSVGSYVFMHSPLQSITIPEGVVSIGDDAFYGCASLSSISLPSTLISIGSEAFTGSQSLVSIHIPSQVASISPGAFWGCKNLTSITVSPENTKYDCRDNCNAIIDSQSNCLVVACKSSVIPSTVTSIGTEAFAACGDRTEPIRIPENVTFIGDYAFASCSNVDAFILVSDTPPSMGEEPFRFIDMTETPIIVPCGLTSLYQQSQGWSSLPYYQEALPYALNITSAQPQRGNVQIIQDPSCSNNTTIINATAFANYTFTNWTENDSIVSTDAEYEFPLDCNRDLVAHFEPIIDLDSPIAFNDSIAKSICVSHWDSNGDGELSYNEALAVTDLGDAFMRSSVTTFDELQYFRGLTTIPNIAFYHCSDLASIVIPNTITSIADRAFANCISLTSIFIPASVNSFGTRVFSYCDELETIIVEDGNNTFDSRDNCNAIIETRTNGLRYGCKGTVIPNSVTAILQEAFFYSGNLTSIDIPNSVTRIEKWAFTGCPLSSITIPSSVSSIVYNSFSSCTELESIVVDQGNTTYDSRDGCNAIIQTSTNTIIKGCVNTVIPETVSSIGNQAFYGINFDTIVIPNSVTSLQDAAFSHCEGLTNVVIPNSITSMGNGVFEYCINLVSVTLPDRITSLPPRAFYYCPHLKTVAIPNSVNSIGINTFRQCYDLQRVVFGNGIANIGDNAFSSCNRISSIAILAETPPSLGNNAFQNVPTNIPVYIPCGLSSSYSNASGWSSFSNYHETSHLLTVSSSNSSYGTATILQDPDCNTNTAIVKAIPYTGCIFESWTANEVVVSTDAEYSFNINSDTELVANFSINGDWSQPIVFADNRVKTLCVNNWDTNGDGELSRFEAFSVTDLGNVFTSNYYITSFDELKYFLGLTSLSFKSFYQCIYLTSITLPATINSIDQLSFWGCNRLSGLTSLAIVPPTVSYNNIFSNTSTTVFIPCGTMEAYSTASGWTVLSDFQEIMPYELTVTSADESMGTILVLQEPGCETEAVIQAIPNEGYAFHSWRKNGILVSTEPTYSFMLTEDSQYTAYFTLQESAVYITAIASPTNGGTVTGAGSYELGTVCTLAALPNEGYGFVHWREGSETVSTESNYSFQVTGNRNLAAIFVPEGALPGTLNGVFSVNDSTQVRFSQGNLQYQASTNTWRFAENQWDYIGGGNNNISENYDGWIDLFCWGTSNYNHGANCYQPWSISDNNADYYAYGSYSYNLYDRTGQADWGYNAISNGGNIEGRWRTLKTEEWDYVFNTRNTASGIRWVQGKVNGKNGTILLPDDWDTSLYLLNNPNGGNYTSNTISANDWSNIFEAHGAVFLPPSGRRLGNSGSYGLSGDYWSSSLYNSNSAYFVYVGNGSIYAQGHSRDRIYGIAVRLVQAIQNVATSYTIEATPNPDEGGTVSGAGTYNEGGTCTLTAIANDGYNFVNWTKEGIEVSTEATYSFTVTENATLVANFSLDNPSPYHWNMNVNEFANNMTAIGIIEIDGQEQFSTTLEVGAFCHGTCRGREKPIYIEAFNRYLMFLTLYGNDGDTLSFRVFDHAIGQELNKTCSSTMVFNTNAIIGSPDVPHIFSFVSGQTSNFPEGWLWWSTYVEQNGINGLQMLEDGLGSNGVMIKSQGNGFVMNSSIGLWYGTLNSIENEATYLVDVNAPTVVEINGGFASPADHPITIQPGWNWIGFPSSNPIAFADAFASFTPTDGDMLKSQGGFAQYALVPSYGGVWYGGLELENLIPGIGLMYLSNNTDPVTLVYPNTGRVTQNRSNADKHWINDIHAYPNNMTVMAVVELDGVELNSDRYELAAFANGECRGSAKLTFVEPINRHMAFLTISGDEATELSFGLYDNQIGTEIFDCSDILAYSTDAIVGKLDEPMIVRFNGTNSIDEIERNLHIYPNPVSCGEHVSITLSIDSKVHIEIIDALGTKVSSETTAQAPAYILAPSTPGVFTIRITVGGKGVYNRKLIVK